jgi:hypothetical protein
MHQNSVSASKSSFFSRPDFLLCGLIISGHDVGMKNMISQSANNLRGVFVVYPLFSGDSEINMLNDDSKMWALSQNVALCCYHFCRAWECFSRKEVRHIK